MLSSTAFRHSRRLFATLTLRLNGVASHRIRSPQACLLSSSRSSFSSKSTPNSVSSNPQNQILLADLVSENKWTDEVKKLLDGPDFVLTHETLIYVLKKLEGNPKKALEFFNWVQSKKFPVNHVAYDIMMRTLVQRDYMKDFWRIVKEIEEIGLVVEDETYQNILTRFLKERMANEAVAWRQWKNSMQEKSAMGKNVNSVVEIVMGDDWNKEVESKLGDLDIEFNDLTVIRVFRDLRNVPLKALSFFRWASSRPEFRQSAVSYAAILRVLGHSDSIEEFWKMVKEMKSEGYELDIDTYIKLTRRFHKWKMMKDSIDLYEFMMQGPYKPSMQECNYLLQQIAYSGRPDMDLVFRVVDIFESAGYSLSKAVYDGIHRSLTGVGRLEEAERIIETMKSAGFEPDNITYSQVVFGLCKAGRLEEACNVLDEMEDHGCTPDIMTWTILIQGHFLAGDANGALSCFTRMLEKSYDADADLISVIVKGLCDRNRALDAYTILIEMVEKLKLRPWQATYKYLIESLLKKSKLEEGLKLLNLMKAQNFPPFPEPFVDYISKHGTVEDAMDYLKALSVKRFPSTSAHVHLLEAFYREGRTAEAQDLLYKFPHHIRNHADILSLFGSSKPGTRIAA